MFDLINYNSLYCESSKLSIIIKSSKILVIIIGYNFLSAVAFVTCDIHKYKLLKNYLTEYPKVLSTRKCYDYFKVFRLEYHIGKCEERLIFLPLDIFQRKFFRDF